VDKLLRLLYRKMITDTVMGIVPGITDKNTAVAFIKQQAEKTIPLKDQVLLLAVEIPICATTCFANTLGA